jgi:hypothetical protein
LKNFRRFDPLWLQRTTEPDRASHITGQLLNVDRGLAN